VADKEESSARRFLKKNKTKRQEQYQEYAVKNLEKIEELLMQHRPGIAEEMKDHIEDFLLSSIQQKECTFNVPAGFDPALLSVLLTKRLNLQRVPI